MLGGFKFPQEIAKDIALQEKKKRKKRKLTQVELSKRAGVSLASLKRFEQTGEISFVSLIKIADISPFSLPLDEKVFLPKSGNFEGIFGVFADSLPDGWGRLLVDRMLLSRGVSPVSVRPVQRLGIVGSTGMGALEYYPELLQLGEEDQMNFEQISRECEKISKKSKVYNFDKGQKTENFIYR